jgi:hypothetical protein
MGMTTPYGPQVVKAAVTDGPEQEALEVGNIKGTRRALRVALQCL